MEELRKYLPVDAKVNRLNDHVTTVVKWNWDYDDCLKFQKKSQEFVKKHKDQKIYIFCNHPHCFTVGRGNERGDTSLVDFDEALLEKLPLPIHKIHRGGGITFHHPGQWIFYPIQNITPDNSLEDLMCWMLKTVRDIIKDDLGIEGVLAANKLMGVWKDKRKFASIGMGMSRFVTEHGLALNLSIDDKMKQALGAIFPCGLTSNTYMSISEFTSVNPDEFQKLFINRLS